MNSKAQRIIRPRHCVQRGMGPWVGRWWRPEAMDEAELRATIVALHRPGDRVYAGTFGHVQVFGDPRRFDARLGAAEALSSIPSAPEWMTSAELGLDERPPAEGGCGLWLVIAGQLRRFALESAHTVDLSQWIDLDGFQFTRSQPLSAWLVQERARSRVSAAGDVDSPNSEPGRPLGGPAPTSSSDELLSAGRPARDAERESFLRAVGKPRKNEISADTVGIAALGERRGLRRGLDRLADMMLSRTPLGRAIGGRQARYFRDLMARFEGGRLDDALRRAIPLSTYREVAERRHSWGVPGVRADFSISPQRQEAGSVIGVMEQFETELRNRYRMAARRLESMGRIEEAAFVHFELLDDEMSGFELLERHRLFVKAARLAESRGAGPAKTIRLWLLAGELQKAVLHARKTGAFSAAVVLLEGREPKLAALLRVAWAETAAADGDFLTAVRVAVRVETARALVLRWIDLGRVDASPLQLGELALHRWFVGRNDPESAVAIRQLRQLLASDDEAALMVGIAVAERLAEAPPEHWPNALAFDLARQLYEASATTAHSRSRQLLGQLRTRGLARTLHQDMPSLPRASTVGSKADRLPRTHTLSTTERGCFEIHDLASLGNGQLAVALGEMGVARMDRSGRVVDHADTPAQRLVASPSGTHVLALRRASGSMSVTARDLRHGAPRVWPPLQMSMYARHVASGRWFCSDGSALVALDSASADARPLWRATMSTGDTIGGIFVHADELLVDVVHRGQHQLWRYDLPAITLRERIEVDLSKLPAGASATATTSRVWAGRAHVVVVERDPSLEDSARTHVLWRAAHAGSLSLVQSFDSELLALWSDASHLLLSRSIDDEIRVELYVGKRLELRASVGLGAAQPLAASGDGDGVFVADDHGRVWGIDPRDGTMLGPWTQLWADSEPDSRRKARPWARSRSPL